MAPLLDLVPLFILNKSILVQLTCIDFSIFLYMLQLCLNPLDRFYVRILIQGLLSHILGSWELQLFDDFLSDFRASFDRVQCVLEMLRLRRHTVDQQDG